ncbi:MAG: hypothetical protein U0325_34855 [Polyangiales bacterium]
MSASVDNWPRYAGRCRRRACGLQRGQQPESHVPFVVQRGAHAICPSAHCTHCATAVSQLDAPQGTRPRGSP